MKDYVYIGRPGFYNWLPELGRSLEVEPGDVVAFENPPTDNQWVPADPPVKARASKPAEKE